jgi:branched-subunit amino acid aminotransferase/4-amino-4-deoxychorismate lyase
MTIELSGQSIITCAAVAAAAIALVRYVANGVRRLDRWNNDYDKLKKQHDADVEKLESELATEIRKNNVELQVLTRGILACLKGLQEKGCNGPVTEAAEELETYLNEKAHAS